MTILVAQLMDQVMHHYSPVYITKFYERIAISLLTK